MLRPGLLLSIILVPSALYASIVLGPESLATGTPSVPITARFHPAIAAARDAVLVAWDEEAGARSSIGGALLLPDGSRRNLEIVHDDVFTAQTSIGGGPAIATDGGSEFFVVWVSAATGFVRGRVVRANGSLGDIQDLSAKPAAMPAVAFNAYEYVVAWEDPADENPLYYEKLGTRIFAQRFDRDGSPIDSVPTLIADATAQAPAIASDGQHVIIAWTWGSRCIKAACHLWEFFDVGARIFNDDLAPQTGFVPVAANPETDEFRPRVISVSSGWFIGWTGWRGISLGAIYDRGWTITSSNGAVLSTMEPPLAVPLGSSPDLRSYIQRKVEDVARLRSVDLIAFVDDQFPRTAILEAGFEQATFSADEVALTATDDRVVIAYARSAPEFGTGTAPQIFIREATVESRSRHRAVMR